MNNIHDNRQASKDERVSETGREINKDIVAPQRISQIPVVREDCQIVRTAFRRFKHFKFRDRRRPPCLCCVSGIHRERNHGSTRSSRPITVHERTAI